MSKKIKIMSKKIKTLSVTINYKVSLGDLDVPKNIYKQIEDAYNNSDSISPSDPKQMHLDASDWLSENIKERDCTHWECEIDEFE